MPRAIWNGKVVAEATRCEVVEGNLYFPREALKLEYFRPSETVLLCGDASRARRELGWAPSKTFEQIVEEMVLADLQLLKRSG